LRLWFFCFCASSEKNYFTLEAQQKKYQSRKELSESGPERGNSGPFSLSSLHKGEWKSKPAAFSY
jgi:hypothetical protein